MRGGEASRGMLREGGARLHRKCPRRELLAMAGPEEEDVLTERVHIIVVVGCAGALGQVGGQLVLEARDVLSNLRKHGNRIQGE